jgi:hypothetical protein
MSNLINKTKLQAIDFRLLIIIALMCATSHAFAPDLASAATAKAFPTAEGYGQDTIGGRGGKVIEVTNLNDSGAGSLRECAQVSTGPRTCVFTIGGTIELDSAIEIRNPYLTIAGQTAPGGGITLKNRNSLRSPIYLYASEVIMRYFRIRSGPTISPSDLNDTVTVAGADAKNIILDHMSLSWATDEGINPSANNMTLQWSILSEGLYHSTHFKPHSKALFATNNKDGSLTTHHNLIAHFVDRNPNIDIVGPIDFTNNVIYNAQDKFGESYDHSGAPSINYVGNVAIAGPSTPKTTTMYPMDAGTVTNPETRDPRFYFDGNLSVQRLTDSGDDRLVMAPEDWHFAKTSPVQPLSVSVTSATQAAKDVLSFAGANVPVRDSVDTRVINEVRTCKGTIIDSPSQVGGWPTLAAGTAPKDSDRDGMPDTWETAQGFNPNLASDRNGDKDSDGYTNLEEYLNELAGDNTPKIGTGTGTVPSPDCGFAITNPSNPKPTVDMGVSLSSANPGEKVVLSWAAANATTCTASGDWSGTKPLHGYELIYPTSAKSFTLTCTGPGGSTSYTRPLGLRTAYTGSLAPSMDVTASATAINPGQSTTISWTSNGATSCNGYGALSGTLSTSGSKIVTPISWMTRYAVTCKNATGLANDEVIISTLGGATSPVPAPTPVTSKFSAGAKVQANATVNVREPAGLSGAIKGQQLTGANGTVLATSPASVDGYIWVPVDFDSGVDGWVVENYLKAYVAPTPTPTPTPTAPTLILTANYTSVVAGSPTALTWTTTNASSCTASGGWTGTKAINGTESMTPTASATYTLACTGAGGPISKSVSVTVTQPTTTTPTPTTSGQTIAVNSSVETTANVNVRSTVGGAKLGNQLTGAKGIVKSGPGYNDGFTWWNADFGSGVDGWVAGQYLKISTAPTPTPTPTPTQAAPTLSIAISQTSVVSGQSAALTWNASNATSCTASGGWSGTKSVSGTETVTPTASATYTLACTGAGGSVSKSVSVSVTQPVAPTLTLSLGTTTVIKGQSSDLTWTTTNASSCTASGGWTGTKAINGIETMTPTASATYTLSCTGAGGSVSKSVAVSVTSNTFGIGASVTVITTDSVRSNPGGAKAGTQLVGAQGKIIEGPNTQDGKKWWKVDFVTGTDGWISEDKLKLVSGQVLGASTSSISAILNEIRATLTAMLGMLK